MIDQLYQLSEGIELLQELDIVPQRNSALADELIDYVLIQPLTVTLTDHKLA